MERVRYLGDIARPPSEAYSLITQATVGCSGNTCCFCRMYKAKQFYIRPVEDVLEDLRRARACYRHIERIFIADGDAMIMPLQNWLKVLDYIKQHFPETTRVTCYATPRSVLLKKPDELAVLRGMGLEMVYIGLESGSNKVLKLMEKGNTAADIIEASKKLHAAGIKISVTAINGLGGLDLLQEHAVETGRVLSAMKPHYIGLLTLMIEPPAPVCQMVDSGELKLLTPEEILGETRLILQNCDCEGAVFRSNHASNYLPLAGTLNRDRDKLISMIDRALEGKTNLRPEYFRAL
jgi:radical SAM superfamily enzyme YgiQ (UPF0313 family)